MFFCDNRFGWFNFRNGSLKMRGRDKDIFCHPFISSLFKGWMSHLVEIVCHRGKSFIYSYKQPNYRQTRSSPATMVHKGRLVLLFMTVFRRLGWLNSWKFRKSWVHLHLCYFWCFRINGGCLGFVCILTQPNNLQSQEIRRSTFPN